MKKKKVFYAQMRPFPFSKNKRAIKGVEMNDYRKYGGRGTRARLNTAADKMFRRRSSM